MGKQELTPSQKRRKQDKILIIITFILIFLLIILSTYMYLTTNDFSKKVVKDEDTTTTSTTTTTLTTSTDYTTGSYVINTKTQNTTVESNKTVNYSFPEDVNNRTSTNDNNVTYTYEYELIGDNYKIIVRSNAGSIIRNISITINGETYKDFNGIISFNKDILTINNQVLTFEVNNSKIVAHAKED